MPLAADAAVAEASATIGPTVIRRIAASHRGLQVSAAVEASAAAPARPKLRP